MPRPQKQDLKDRILRSAENKFFTKGSYKISVDEIVADASTSKAAVYRFFSTKDELVEAVLNNLNSHINASIGSIINNDEIDFPKKLQRIIEFTSKLFQKINIAFFKDLQEHNPTLENKYQKMRLDRINTYYRKLFKEGIKQNIVRKDIPLDFILYFYSRITEIAIFPSDGIKNKYTPNEIYKYISALFYEGTRR